MPQRDNTFGLAEAADLSRKGYPEGAPKAEGDSELEQQQPEWEKIERVRPPWVLQEHSERIPPQKDQKSNNDLTNEQVLQPRAEPVGKSAAPPLTGRMSSGHSDEPSGYRHSQSFRGNGKSTA